MNIYTGSLFRYCSAAGLVAGIAVASAGHSAMAAPVPTVSACTAGGAAGQVKALARSSAFSVKRDFSGGIESGVPYPAGSFGPTPLFRTTVVVDGASDSCLLATLSTDAQPYDNAMIFQVRVDGKPMLGHWNPASFLSGNPNMPQGFNVPIVWQANLVPGANEYADPPRLGSYSFLANVPPGAHIVEVVAAGCCGADSDLPPETVTGLVRSATLVLQYR